MKLASGKRIGQSGSELGTAALFSFFLHAILFAAALFYLQGAPKKQIPLFYEVKLVGLPSAPEEVAARPASQPALPKPPAAPKAKKPAPKARKAPARKAPAPMPRLAKPQQRPAAPAAMPEAPASREAPEAAAPAPAPAAGSAGEQQAAKSEGVAVTTPQQDFKYAWYLNQVRDKISQNWRPPPDAPDAKARVIFSINRSGWVGEVSLDAEHSTGTFGFKQAAIRAIRASNPFPSLPEEFSKQTLEFSVDLMAEQ